MARQERHHATELRRPDSRPDSGSSDNEGREFTLESFGHELETLARMELTAATEKFGPGTVLAFETDEEIDGLEELPGLCGRLVGLGDAEAVGAARRLREAAARIDIGLDSGLERED